MRNENNKNAVDGRDTEMRIKNSIAKQPETVKKLKNKFNIKGELENTGGGGFYGGKADVRINFTCGHYVDVSVKGFKNNAGFNQLARTSVSKFCTEFGIENEDKKEIEDMVVAKSKNTKNPLFPEDMREKWKRFFEQNAKKILKWGFTKNPSREIFVLYNRDTSVVRIYAMKDILKRLSVFVAFTKGGLNIGDCVSLQRKGGNGVLKANRILKTSIKHPGNNIQLKIKINKFIELMDTIKLAEYKI
ncbi:MAG: hypothetical protein LBM93_09195 [Oscillospiraceae bacterium]|jgi:hypothetical protein|nr:hypothetical protein [Oscillospiraceae bacterium]